MQKIACGYWMLHYAKRIAETFLVHVCVLLLAYWRHCVRAAAPLHHTTPPSLVNSTRHADTGTLCLC